MLSRLFRKRGVVSSATRSYKKCAIVDIKGMGAVQTEMPSKCYHGKTGSVYVTHRAPGISVDKRVMGKILAKRINAWIEHIEHCKRQDGFLKKVKKNN